MVVSGNDPVESFFNSINGIKEAFLPLEVGIRKAKKDIEHCWLGTVSNKGKVNEIEGSKFQICGVKNKKGGECVVVDERKKELLVKVNLKSLLGVFSQNGGNGIKGEVLKEKEEVVVAKDEGSCVNCLKFSVTWSLFVNGFLQALPAPFKQGRKRAQEIGYNEDKLCSCMKPIVSCEVKQNGSKGQFVRTIGEKGVRENEGKYVSLECLVGFTCDQLSQTLQSLDQGVQESGNDCGETSTPPPHFLSHFSDMNGLEGHKVYVNKFLGNLRFAKVGGVPSNVIEVSHSTKEVRDGSAIVENREDTGGSSPQKFATNILSVSLSKMARIRYTLSTVSLTELVEQLPQLGRVSAEHPDKKKLFSVQDFFRYTETEGRRFFEELDRDGDGKVTLEDLEIAMSNRKLPRRYAHEFMSRTRSHLFAKSFGLKRFLSLMEQKEPTILRAYTSLCLSKYGTLKKSEVLESLQSARLPANDDNAVAMMRFLNADTEGSISYGHFRNFMLLLPSDRLQEDPRTIWFEAATVVAVPPPVEIPVGSVLRSALAGGFSCALSCALMHPVDTVKTQVQASTLSFPEIILKLPHIGARGLYKGSIPAILGQFTSHGLRTGIYEASKMVLRNAAPTLPEMQVHSMLSFCSTILGTAMRIPSEVLKQRLQAGLYDNVGEALVGTWRQEGLKGFFRGTGATLCREVPFYVAGMGLYDESKKVVQKLLRRELEPWEMAVVGAITGGLASVTTTPFDVVKTRMMTSQGQSVSMSMVAFSILRHEGPLGLFKGAIPRFFWIAPLGAMNFAGYELARKALNKYAELAGDQRKE
ncbi:hypothetical protein RIF29_18450 [Crotalaria pallida]|uniref:EF-hand domain-containing protein n=1 Tax=Crotalaria pallida TaxID=3830 RepID=A0AAN9IG76_CROPI